MKGHWTRKLVHLITRSDGGDGTYWFRSSEDGSLCSGDLHQVPVQESGQILPHSSGLLSNAPWRELQGQSRKRRKASKSAQEQQQGADLGQGGFYPTLPEDAGNITWWESWKHPPSHPHVLLTPRVAWVASPEAQMCPGASLTMRHRRTHRGLQGHSCASSYTGRKA